MKYSETLKNKPVYIKSTWVAAYSIPEALRANRVISYNSDIIEEWKVRDNVNIADDRIGELTGNYVIESGFLWFEMTPYYCNRANIVYVKANSVTDAGGTAYEIPEGKDFSINLGKVALFVGAALLLKKLLK